MEEALSDPYLASLHDPSDEPLAHAAFSFEFERMALTKQVLRQLITKEMISFHPGCGWDADLPLHAEPEPPLPQPTPAAPPAAGTGAALAASSSRTGIVPLVSGLAPPESAQPLPPPPESDATDAMDAADAMQFD